MIPQLSSQSLIGMLLLSVMVISGYGAQSDHVVKINVGIQDTISAQASSRHVPALGTGVMAKGTVKQLNAVDALRANAAATVSTILSVRSLTRPLMISFVQREDSLVNAQAKRTSSARRELYKRVSELDKAVFDAFNACDSSKIGTLCSSDIEFYHDQGGIFAPRSAFVESLKKKFSDPNYKARRELVKGSLEVFPLGDFGALELGQHRFYGIPRGQQERLDAMGRFVTVWERNHGMWTMYRELSYDHRDPGGRGTSPSPELTQTMGSMEALLVNALNTAEASKSKDLFAVDAEFYGQETGLTKSWQAEAGSLRNVKNRFQTTRALAPDTLETFPLNDPSGANYGVIETGEYHWTAHEGGRIPNGDRTTRFIHVWLKKDGTWKLSRSIDFEK